MQQLTLALIATLFSINQALAQPQVKARILIQESSSWDGGQISYPEGDAQLSIVRITIPENAVITMHCHPMPLAAYMTKGEIEVTTSSGEKHRFRKGDAFIEVMNRWHKGAGITGESELIAVYVGNSELPLSLMQHGDSPLAKSCQ